MRNYILIFMILLPSPALAYDDEIAAKKLMACLIHHQKQSHYTDNMALASSCEPEAMDFMRYACPNDIEQCEGLAFQAAQIVIQRDRGGK